MQKVLVLHDFMLKDKKLKGSRLLVYALIYSYSQIPNSTFYCSYKHASSFLGISKSSYFEALQWLIDNKYLTSDYDVSELLHNHHVITSDVSPMWNKTIEETIKIAQYKWVK